MNSSSVDLSNADGYDGNVVGREIFRMNNSIFAQPPSEKSRVNPLSSPLDMHAFLGRQDLFLDTFYPSTNSVVYGTIPYASVTPQNPSLKPTNQGLSLLPPRPIVFQDFPLFESSHANKTQNASMAPDATRAESGNMNNPTAAVKKRKVNRSQLSTDCLEILKKYKKAGICVPNKSDIPADLELALMENYELLSTRRKLRCLPREWKVIAENLSKEECIQYLKYHRWKEPVTNAPKGSGCRVSQCAIHSGCNHLLKMR